MEIKSYNEFKTDDPKMLYEFKGSLLNVVNQGNPSEKKPFRFRVIMEESGEIAEIVSWDFQYLTLVENGLSDNNIYEVEVNVKLNPKYNDAMNLRLVNIRKTEAISSRKQTPENIDAKSVEVELREIVNKYVRNPICRSIIDLVLSNPDFYTRPAAVSVHHAYSGGLAEHTLGVTKIAMNLYRTYSDYCSLDLLITGAIIHDIGKIIEYTNTMKFSYEGGYNTHITYGISMLTNYANGLGLQITDPIIMQLIGIIASHHNLLEYGSPSRPATTEAMLVSFADQVDAGMKGALESLSNLPEGSRTDPIKSLNGAKFVSINNKKLFKQYPPIENSEEK